MIVRYCLITKMDTAHTITGGTSELFICKSSTILNICCTSSRYSHEIGVSTLSSRLSASSGPILTHKQFSILHHVLRYYLIMNTMTVSIWKSVRFILGAWLKSLCFCIKLFYVSWAPTTNGFSFGSSFVICYWTCSLIPVHSISHHI